MVLWLALAATSATGGVIAAVFALACVAGRGRVALRRSFLVLLGAFAVNAPWIVAGALHGGSAVSDPRGVEAFAARAEGLLSLPADGPRARWDLERRGHARLTCRVGRRGRAGRDAGAERRGGVGVAGASYRVVTGRRWWSAAAVGLVVTLLGNLFPHFLAWLASTVPGAGLLRDGSRFLALLAPLLACLFGLGVSAAGRTSCAPTRSA